MCYTMLLLQWRHIPLSEYWVEFPAVLSEVLHSVGRCHTYGVFRLVHM